MTWNFESILGAKSNKRRLWVIFYTLCLLLPVVVAFENWVSQSSVSLLIGKEPIGSAQIQFVCSASLFCAFQLQIG